MRHKAYEVLAKEMSSVSAEIVKLKNICFSLGLQLDELTFESDADLIDVRDTLYLLLKCGFYDLEFSYPGERVDLSVYLELSNLRPIAAKLGSVVLRDLLIEVKRQLSVVIVAYERLLVYVAPIYELTGVNVFPTVLYSTSCSLSNNTQTVVANLGLVTAVFCNAFFSNDRFRTQEVQVALSPLAEYYVYAVASLLGERVEPVTKQTLSRDKLPIADYGPVARQAIENMLNPETTREDYITELRQITANFIDERDAIAQQQLSLSELESKLQDLRERLQASIDSVLFKFRNETQLASELRQLLLFETEAMLDDLDSSLYVAATPEEATELRTIIAAKTERDSYNMTRALALVQKMDQTRFFDLVAIVLTPEEDNLHFLVALSKAYFTQYAQQDLDLVLLPLYSEAALGSWKSTQLQLQFDERISGRSFNLEQCRVLIEKLNENELEKQDVAILLQGELDRVAALLWNVSYFVSTMLRLGQLLVSASPNVDDPTKSNEENKQELAYAKLNKTLSAKLYLNQKIVDMLTLFEDSYYIALLRETLTVALGKRLSQRDAQELGRYVAEKLAKWRAVNTEELSKLIISLKTEQTTATLAQLLQVVVERNESEFQVDTTAILEGGYASLNKLLIKLYFINPARAILRSATPTDTYLYMELRRNPNFYVEDQLLTLYVLHITLEKIGMPNNKETQRFVRKLIASRSVEIVEEPTDAT